MDEQSARRFQRLPLPTEVGQTRVGSPYRGTAFAPADAPCNASRSHPAQAVAAPGLGPVGAADDEAAGALVSLQLQDSLGACLFEQLAERTEPVV